MYSAKAFTVSRILNISPAFTAIIEELFSHSDEGTEVKIKLTSCEGGGPADARKVKQKPDENGDFSHVRLPSDTHGRGRAEEEQKQGVKKEKKKCDGSEGRGNGKLGVVPASRPSAR